jgi:hypothetical protein
LVCQKYRDRILSISQFADITAAAFHDAFPRFLRESSRGEDARAWTSFASLVKRQRKSQNRGAQLLRLQTGIVAIWGNDVFTHYGWSRLPLDSTKLLHSVASTLRDWNIAVEVINETILARHERRVVNHDNRARQIGEHSRSSKIQDPHSPIEPRDLEIILSRIKDDNFQISPQTERIERMFTIGGTPIQEHGLASDRFGMIVPDSTSRSELKSTIPNRQANKRRRMNRNDHMSSAETEDLQVSDSCHQPAFASTYRSDSELTEFEEETFAGSAGANSGCSLQTPIGRSGLRSDVNDAQNLTPEASVREITYSFITSPVQSASRSHDAMSDMAISPPQNNVSAGIQTEGYEGDAYTSLVDFDLTPGRGSARSSHQESSPRSQDATLATEYQDEDWQETFNSLDKGFGCIEMQVVVVDRAYEAVSAGENHRPRLLHVQKLPTLQPSDGTIPENRSESVTLDFEASSLSAASCVLFPASTEGSKGRYCTDTDVEDDGTIIGRMASRHSKRFGEVLNTAQKHHDDRSEQEHNESKVKWLEETRWASLYAAPIDLDSASQLPLDADVWYMDWKTFQRRADGGEVFRKPVVVKQTFQDSGMYEPYSYMAMLRERFPNQKLDVHNSKTGECMLQSIADLPTRRATSDATDTDESIACNNAINLRKIANADAPLLTRMKRFRLLETLVDRMSNLAPGKRICREAYDVSDCLGFDLLGFSGAFSRPHVDALAGSWVRCLCGSKAWIFAPGMNDEDWENFAQDGAQWSPGDKGRIIILEKDDVLLMPPGVRVLHTVFTLETSLMVGGMLWDEYNIQDLLDELLWVGQNQLCTNEAIAYQLPKIIDSLEIWIEENGARLSPTINEYITSVQQGIRRLRSLGCKCSGRCDKNGGCRCGAQRRRCTAWCSKHPALPSQATGQFRQCMYE